MGRSKAKESKAGSISILKQQNYYINKEGNAETNTTGTVGATAITASFNETKLQ